jgi:hypothetical protein
MNNQPNESHNDDPLIDEVRAIRQAMSAENGNDVGRLCDQLRAVQRRYASRIVSRRPRAAPPTPQPG